MKYKLYNAVAVQAFIVVHISAGFVFGFKCPTKENQHNPLGILAFLPITKGRTGNGYGGRYWSCTNRVRRRRVYSPLRCCLRDNLPNGGCFCIHPLRLVAGLERFELSMPEPNSGVLPITPQPILYSGASGEIQTHNIEALQA